MLSPSANGTISWHSMPNFHILYWPIVNDTFPSLRVKSICRCCMVRNASCLHLLQMVNEPGPPWGYPPFLPHSMLVAVQVESVLRSSRSLGDWSWQKDGFFPPPSCQVHGLFTVKNGCGSNNSAYSWWSWSVSLASMLFTCHSSGVRIPKSISGWQP